MKTIIAMALLVTSVAGHAEYYCQQFGGGFVDCDHDVLNKAISQILDTKDMEARITSNPSAPQPLSSAGISDSDTTPGKADHATYTSLNAQTSSETPLK